MKRRAGKSPNGEGRTPGFPVTFDLNIEAERTAHEVSQRLASRAHGLRKHLIVSLLCAIAEYEQVTGREINPDEITGRIFTQGLTGRGFSGQRPSVLPDVEMPDLELELKAAKKASALEQSANAKTSALSRFGRRLTNNRA